MTSKKDNQNLTPEQLYITQKQGTEPAFSGNTTIPKQKDLTIVFVVVQSYLAPQVNLIQERDGQVFGNLLQKRVLKLMKTYQWV